MSRQRFECSQRYPFFVHLRHVGKPNETLEAPGYQPLDDWSRKCEVLADEVRRVPSRAEGPHYEGMESQTSPDVRQARQG